MKAVLARVRILAVAVLATIVSTGCLEWDQQVLTFRHDRKSDTLLIFQDYRGIYGADHQTKLLDSEVEQLKSVLKGRRTFFFSNWILEINLQALPDMIADLENESPSRVTEQEMHRRGLLLMKFVQQNCSIENGDFYLDDKKRISGVQRVKIRKVSKLLPLLNAAVLAAYKDEAMKHQDDLARQTYLNQVSGEDWQFVRFNGNQLVVPVPLTKEDYEKQFRSESSSVEMANFEKSGMKFEHRDGVLTYSIGNPKGRFTRVEVETFTATYRDNFRAHLPKDIIVKEAYDSDAAAKKFVLGK
ncbi:MAG: hypothetical protein ACPGVU_02605 [Limisphaerales bacterium]